MTPAWVIFCDCKFVLIWLRVDCMLWSCEILSVKEDFTLSRLVLLVLILSEAVVSFVFVASKSVCMLLTRVVTALRLPIPSLSRSALALARV